MRFTKSDLHPTIFDAVNQWQSHVTMTMATDLGLGKSEKYEAYNRHQKVWWKEYGKAVLIGSGIWATLIAGCLVAAKATDNRMFAAGAMLSICAAVAHGIWAYYENKKLITLDELEALLPSLDLSQLQVDYCAAFVDLYKNKGIDTTHRKEILGQLNLLIDESARLSAQKVSLSEYLGATEHREKLRNEVERLESKMNATQDQVTRDTYAGSLEIARKRLERFGASAPILERIDAQIELVSQTMGSMREVLVRLRNAPSVDSSDLGSLRTRVEQIQNQGNILESAFDEIRALA